MNDVEEKCIGFRTLTKVVYPDGGPKFDKWDYFIIPVECVPENWQSIDPDEFYDYINNLTFEGSLTGGWVKGWCETDDDLLDDTWTWIDDHPECQGMQTEVCVEVDEW